MAPRRVKSNGATAAAGLLREWRAERAEVLAAAQAMEREGLVMGSSGNVSRRVADSDGRQLMAITSSSVAYERITGEEIVIVDFEGEPLTGDLVPSTETLTHAAIYLARPDVGAVMHTHSTYSSALAVAGLDIPPLIDEAVLALGGGVRVAEYGFPSSQELADHAVAALGRAERGAAAQPRPGGRWPLPGRGAARVPAGGAAGPRIHPRPRDGPRESAPRRRRGLGDRAVPHAPQGGAGLASRGAPAAPGPNHTEKEPASESARLPAPPPLHEREP